MGLFGSTPAASAPQDRVDIDHLIQRVGALEATVQRLQQQLTATIGAAAAPAEGAGATGVPGAQAAAEPPFMVEVRGLAAQGKKINAIKVYREQTGASLKDAKNAVERLY